jgi:hypothetical protein
MILSYRLLSINDVLLQIAGAAFFHGLSGDEWNTFSTRLGWVLPVTMMFVAGFKLATMDAPPNAERR